MQAGHLARAVPRMLAVLVLALLLVLFASQSGAALAQDDPTGGPSPGPAGAPPGDTAAGTGSCSATGYLVGSDGDLSQVRGDLARQPVQQLDGVALVSGQTWVIPDGEQPVIVIDSTEPMTRGTVLLTVAGQEFEAASRSLGAGEEEPPLRYVSGVELPHLGPTLRTLGLTVQARPCADLRLTVSVERSVWSTLVGKSAIAATALFGLLLVLVARLRKGGWLRRFAFAAPFGLLAGVAQVAVLVGSGAVSPFDLPPWWIPLVGLGLAAVLPLTRWRRRPAPDDADPMPPASAPLGGYRVDAAVARTDVAVVYRATRVAPPPPPPTPVADGDEPTEVTPPPAPPAPERALLKVASAERFGEPLVRLRLEREARALTGLAHPNVLRLRETMPAPAGSPVPPTLVFDDLDGAPLRQVLAGDGSLSGPQVANVVLGVLDGLDAVHERGLVHRDVRPENVWLTTDGRVLLAGFELAAAGVEHPVSPEGEPPYASPEQRAGSPLDGRSDVWACGVLLAELLTGEVPARAVDPAAAGPVAPAGVPGSLATLLERALSADPDGRPAAAGQFASELRVASEAAFGSDWAGRGALAGALVAHGAIGAGAAGYALAGGTAGGAVTAGAGAAGTASAASGVASAAGAAASGTAAVPTAAGAAAATTMAATGTTTAATGTATATTATMVAAGAAGAGQGSSGPVVAVVNAGIAVAAAAAIAVTAALVDPAPAAAEESEVITPDQARVIFVRTMDEGQHGVYDHFGEDAEPRIALLTEQDSSIEDAPVTEVVVGVPPEQFGFPAWFVASAVLPYEDGMASVFARFDREAADGPWLMSALDWSLNRLLPAPRLEDGWLAPVPGVGDLLVDPGSLPGRYQDWFARSSRANEVVDDVLALRHDDVGMVVYFTDEDPYYNGDDPHRVTHEYETSAGDLASDLVPLADGTVWVTFRVTVSHRMFYLPRFRGAACDDYWLFWIGGSPPGRYRLLSHDLVVTVNAWVPVPELIPEPATSPDPSPDPSPEASEAPGGEEEGEVGEPAGLELERVDPETVVIEDFWITQENAGGDRC